MDTKTKELIAIGAAATANCIPCLRFHFSKAQQAGATTEEIRTAVGVGRMVRKGAAEKWDEQADTLLGTCEQTSSTTGDSTCSRASHAPASDTCG
jgi:AhpD family alkylhydroperoxidase